jgi:hypothetical protein
MDMLCAGHPASQGAREVRPATLHATSSYAILVDIVRHAFEPSFHGLNQCRGEKYLLDPIIKMLVPRLKRHPVTWREMFAGPYSKGADNGVPSLGSDLVGLAGGVLHWLGAKMEFAAHAALSNTKEGSKKNIGMAR